MISLRSSKVVRTLETRARKDHNAAALLGVVRPIMDDVTPLLEFIRHSFPSYPNHGIDHSIRILEKIGGILSEEALKSLSSYELFCLILAAIFHDAGMVAPDSSVPNDSIVRGLHHKRSAELFLKYFPERLALLSNQRMAQAVAFAIESHGLSWEEMQNRPEFFQPETVDGEHIRPCVIAILLRVGDLLDLDRDRTSDLCLKYCANWYKSADAINHNERHHYVKTFFYNSKKIDVRVDCPTRAQYDIWFSWLEYLRLDIERANTYVFNDDLAMFRLPVPNLKCQPSADAKFELWPLRFEIDESGELWDVISKSVYTGKYDYVRELIQNSIDACLRRIYESPYGVLTGASPRGWRLSDYTPRVLVIISRRNKQLVVADNGIGMDRHTIQHFLFRVAGSGMKRQNQNRPYRFPSIATFGVGFISVLTRATKLRLMSKRVSLQEGKSYQAICIRLDANLRDAIVEKAPDLSEGTTILLSARDAQYLKGIKNYISEMFRYPSVGIHLLDLDELEEIIEDIQKNQIPVDLSESELIKNYLENGIGIIGDLIERADKLVGRIKRAREIYYSVREQGAEGRRNYGALYRKSDPIPMITISATEPERLPINSAFHFYIGKGIILGRARAINYKTPELPLYRALVIVPIQFIDSTFGVEWRSLHSFLVADGIVTKRISFVRSAKFGSREFLLRNDTGSYYDSIATELEMSEDNPYDLVEMMKMREERQSRRDVPEDDSLYGTMLVSSRNSIIRYVDVDIDKVDLDSDNIEFESLYFSDKENFFETATTTKGEILDSLRWYINNRQAVYQDGIRLPIMLSDIAPVGAVVGVANLLADSRLTYNISRNAIDESEDKLKAWRSGPGKFILKQIAVTVKRTLDQIGVDYRWKDLWNGEENAYLSRLHEWNVIEPSQ